MARGTYPLRLSLAFALFRLVQLGTIQIYMWLGGFIFPSRWSNVAIGAVTAAVIGWVTGFVENLVKDRPNWFSFLLAAFAALVSSGMGIFLMLLATNDRPIAYGPLQVFYAMAWWGLVFLLAWTLVNALDHVARRKSVS